MGVHSHASPQRPLVPALRPFSPARRIGGRGAGHLLVPRTPRPAVARHSGTFHSNTEGRRQAVRSRAAAGRRRAVRPSALPHDRPHASAEGRQASRAQVRPFPSVRGAHAYGHHACTGRTQAFRCRAARTREKRSRAGGRAHPRAVADASPPGHTPTRAPEPGPVRHLPRLPPRRLLPGTRTPHPLTGECRAVPFRGTAR